LGATFSLTRPRTTVGLAARCPCCGGSDTHIMYRVPSIPVHSCILLETEEAARAFPRRDLELAFCHDCGFVFNGRFDETVMGYSTNFEESQHFSGTFNSFAKGLAAEIADKCEAPGKRALEIGCGKGEFLREFCRVGKCQGIGIDPGYRADAGRDNVDASVEFIVDHFGAKYQGLVADITLCRHTLEHIASVAPFTASIRRMLAARADAWVVFETPDAARVLAEGAFWDIYYEHCSYFSAGTHARLFRSQGFEVTDLSLAFDRQYIIQYARPASGPTQPKLALEDDIEEMRGLADGFPMHVAKVRNHWLRRVRETAAAGQKIVLWGGGSKGVSFLTTLGLTSEVAALVDVNPYKQGKFAPGSGHQVLAPTALREARPDLIIVMNPIYLAEIGSMVSELGLASVIEPVSRPPEN
jgi:SAM-dependent methyltransferase